MSVIALAAEACWGWAASPPSISRSCPGFLCSSVSTGPVPSVLLPPVAAALRREPRLGPAASSRTPLALPATACSAPLVPPERTGLAARHVTHHHTASEPLDRSNPRTDVLVHIDQRNPCNCCRRKRCPCRTGMPCSNRKPRI
jgi:hypothetical protein